MVGYKEELAASQVILQLLHGPLNGEVFLLDGGIALLGGHQIMAYGDYWMLLPVPVL